MKKLPNHQNNSQLSQFLRKYQPIAPPAPDDFEHNLFTLIEKESQVTAQKYNRKWILPSAIAASLMLILSSYYFLKPASQTANQNQEIEEMEKFFVDSWDGAIKGNSFNNETTPEGQWLILTNFSEDNRR